jgi:flagellar motor protein MotB
LEFLIFLAADFLYHATAVLCSSDKELLQTHGRTDTSVPLMALHALQAQLQAPDQLDREVRELQKQAVAQWKAERAAQEAAQQRQDEERQRCQRQQQAEQLQRKRAELKQQIDAAKAAKQQAAEAAVAAAAAQVRGCKNSA